MILPNNISNIDIDSSESVETTNSFIGHDALSCDYDLVLSMYEKDIINKIKEDELS